MYLARGDRIDDGGVKERGVGKTIGEEEGREGDLY